MKPGIKTTEFWVTILTVFYGAFGNGLGITETQADEIIARIAAAIVAIVYIIARMIAKKESPNTDTG